MQTIQMQKSVNHEKTMTQLYKIYHRGINQLKTGRYEEGTKTLMILILDKAMADSDLDNLRYSTLLSLAEVSQIQQQSLNALSFLWQAVQIITSKQKKSDSWSISAQQINEERSNQEFNLLVKMIQVSENLNLIDPLIYLLKRALSVSPRLWRQKILDKLRNIYEKQNRIQTLNDMNFLTANQLEMQAILFENRLKIFKQPIQFTNFPLSNYLQKFTIKLSIPDLIKNNLWQLLFTNIYVLLKCQSNRNFNKKKYLRKFDENNAEWLAFIKDYNISKTSIEVIVENQQKDPQEDSEINSKIVSQMALQILKYTSQKKRLKKSNIHLEQLSRISSKEVSKKQLLLTQTKSIYSSIWQYYKQILSKGGLKRQYLNNLKFFDVNIHNQIFGKIITDQISAPADDQQQIQGQGSNSVKQSLQQQKQLKQKKGKNKRQDLINYHEQINQNLKDLFNQRKNFPNILQLVVFLASYILKLSLKSCARSLIKNQSIRHIFAKVVLKLIEISDGFLNNIFDENKIDCEEKNIFLELLISKYEQLSLKIPKTPAFKTHQQTKKKILVNHINQYYRLSIYKINNYLQSNLSVDILQHLSKRTWLLLRLNHGNYSSIDKDIHLEFKYRFQLKSQELQMQTSQKKQQIKKKLALQFQKDIEKLAIRQNAFNEQNEDKNTKIDDLLRRDQQICSALPLLRYFNIEGQSKLSGLPQEEPNGSSFLLIFIKIVQKYFRKLEGQSQFNSRLVVPLAEVLHLKQIVQNIYSKFLNNNNFKAGDISTNIFTQTLFYLIRLYLLNIYEQTDSCIRIIFYITSILLRQSSEEIKQIHAPRCIILYDQIINYKKFKPELLTIVRKKFYNNMIVKHLPYVYSSPLFQAQFNTKKSKSQRNVTEQQQIRQKMFDILHDIYFNPEKDKQFIPKKIEDALGYFLYLSRANYSEFHCKVVELQNEVCKILKKSIKLYLDRRGDIYTYCSDFINFRNCFDRLMNGDEQQINKQYVLGVIRQQRKICNCCNLKQSHPFHLEVLFIIGKFFEAKPYLSDLNMEKEIYVSEPTYFDQKYYFEYLCFKMEEEVAWQNLIRVNCNKSYIYFDSLPFNPCESLKDKFLYTKKLISIASELPFAKMANYGTICSQILNTLKIKEREYHLVLKQIQNYGTIATKQSRQCSRKYKEGLKKLWSVVSKSPVEDIKVRYLRLVQIQMKLIWINLDKQSKEQEKKEMILNEEENDRIRINRFHQQFIQIFTEIRQIITSLPQFQKHQHTLHLQEDLIVEVYMFIYRVMEWKLQKMISKFCQSIRISDQRESGKKLKQMQAIFGQLEAMTKLIAEGQALTSNSKYQLRLDKMLIAANQMTDCLNKLVLTHKQQNNINAMKEVSKVENQKIQIIKNKKNQQIIILSDDQPQDIINLDKQNKELQKMIDEEDEKQYMLQRIQNKDEMNIKKIQKQEEAQFLLNQNKQQESVQSVSHSSHSSLRQKSKDIVLDVPHYFHQRIKQYTKDNQLASLKLPLILPIITSAAMTELLLKISKIFQQICHCFILLPKYQIKRYKNRRSVVNPLLLCSQATLRYSLNPERSSDLIRQYYNIKSDELVHINMHNDKIATQKNQVLAEFYNRTIVHQLMKIKFLQHMLKMFNELSQKDNMVVLIRKLSKLSKQQDKVQSSKISKAIEQVLVDQKDRQNKNKQQMIHQGQQNGKQEKIVDKLKLEKDKAKQQKQIENPCYYLLFCEGVSNYVDVLKRQSAKGQLEEKYEKNLLEFKNRMKKSANKDENNYYLAKVEEFLNFYEEKFNKKIRMKKTKKQKQIDPEKKTISIDKKNKNGNSIDTLIKQNQQINLQIKQIKENKFNAEKPIIREIQISDSKSKSKEKNDKRQKSPKSKGPKKQKKIKRESKKESLPQVHKIE